MKTSKSRIIVGAALFLALVILGGGLVATTIFAQGPGQGGYPTNSMHNNQAVLDLLKSTEQDLYQMRQSGKSWLEIATTKGATEIALIDAMLEPMTDNYTWMAQMHPQITATQMTEWMRTQFANDIRVTQFGTMADRHIFGMAGMMGNWSNANGFGMMNGGGMMGNWNDNDEFGGMMGGGGMMRGWNNGPDVTPNPTK